MIAISILLPNYNKEKYLSESIESVLAQSFRNWELLILDDYSLDDSKEVIKQYLQDDRVKFFRNKKRLGKTLSLKRLADIAKGEIIVEFDSDDLLDKNTLGKIYEAYQNNKYIGMVYSQCYYCDEHLRPIHKGFCAAIPKGKSNLHVNSVVALRSYRKKDYFKTAGYDEKIKYAEDIDLVLKLEEVTKLYFLDEPLYYYRVLPKSQTHSFKNTRINRSSTALAKLNAYKRRLNTDIPNLNKAEISEVLYWGIINALLAARFKLFLKLKFNLFIIHPFFFLDFKFYKEVFKKIKKIIKLKKEKPLLKI